MAVPLNTLEEWFVDTVRKKVQKQRSKGKGRIFVKVPLGPKNIMSALKKVNDRPKFSKTIPMSNFDLLDWSKYLKIPLKNVLSRDEKVPHNHKLGLFVYNLEPAYMSGSHWVATYVRDNVINYFDSFGMARSFSRDGKSCKENKT